jgi:hypothetical protein
MHEVYSFRAEYCEAVSEIVLHAAADELALHELGELFQAAELDVLRISYAGEAQQTLQTKALGNGYMDAQ